MAKSGGRFPVKTALIAILILGLGALIIISNWPKDPGSMRIGECEFPPNPVFSSETELKAYVNDNLGYFEGRGTPVLLDNMSPESRNEQMRAAVLCSIHYLYPDLSDDGVLCRLKTIFLPSNPSEAQLQDAQAYCVKDANTSEADAKKKYKLQDGALGNLQTLLRKDPETKFSLDLGSDDRLSQFWVRRTAVVGGYADLIDKICDDPINTCLECSIRPAERRASIGLKGELQACIHNEGGEFFQCKGAGSEGGATPSCKP